MNPEYPAILSKQNWSLKDLSEGFQNFFCRTQWFSQVAAILLAWIANRSLVLKLGILPLLEHNLISCQA